MNTFEATTAADWRDWLATHGASRREIWLVMRRKDSPVPGICYEDAVSQALCFGWIDGHHRGRDEHSSLLRFTPRTPRSVWSRPNRERAAKRPDTRARRIERTVVLAAQGIRANHPGVRTS